MPHREPGGAVLKKTGANAAELLTTQRKRAYFLLGFEPEMDCAASAAAMETLQQAGLVVCLSPYVTSAMEDYADFILPITPFTETAGTFVNVAGVAQSFAAVSVPYGESKPAWKIFRVLANFMELPGFDYADIHQVQAELQDIIGKVSTATPASSAEFKLNSELKNSAKNHEQLFRLAPWPLYRTDPLVRRAGALQETMSNGHLATIAVHSELGQKIAVNRRPACDCASR